MVNKIINKFLPIYTLTAYRLKVTLSEVLFNSADVFIVPHKNVTIMFSENMVGLFAYEDNFGFKLFSDLEECFGTNF